MDPRTIQLSAYTTIVIRFMIAIVVAAAAFLVFARESNACTYAPIGSPTEELGKASEVFAGKVIAATSIPDGRVYQFKVHTVWKGALHDNRFILRNVGVYAKGTSCEGTYEQYIVGQEYLVYDDIYVSSRTRLLMNANEDLAELGEGQRPEPGSSGPVPPALIKAREDIAKARVREEQAAQTRTLFVVSAVAFLVVMLICVVLWKHAVSRR